MSKRAATGNFLTRLAGQASGAVAALRPRLPALFEPVSPTPAGADVASAEPRRRSLQESSGHEAVMPWNDGMDMPARDAPVRHRGRQVAPTGTSSDNGQPSPTRVALAGVAVAEPGSGSAAAIVIPSRADATRATSAAAASGHAASGSAAGAAGARPARGAAVEMLAPDRSLARSPRNVRGDPADAPRRSTTHVSSAPERVRSSAVADAPGRGRSDANDAEPIVRVSIGRIEVRAVAAPAATARAAERPRPAPLDDYLRQRGRTR